MSEEANSENSFCEGGVSLEKDGVKCTLHEEGHEIFYSYEDVKFYRAVSHKRTSGTGQEKLFLTIPVPSLTSYNRYRFKADGKDYFTYEFSQDEKERAEEVIREYGISVSDRKSSANSIKMLYKVFREDGGIAHRIVAISVFVVVALIIGAIIMFLINHFLHTANDTLAIVFGIFCLPCLAVVVIKSQELGSKVKIYDKGVYLKIRSKSGYGGTTSPFAIEKAYFAWEEVECVERVQSQVDYIVQFRLGYCVLSVPDFDGLYEYIEKRFPEKCKSKEA
ncbi:MAG: hypothetical protein K2L02_00350 [Clostridia bacterium]|nr:hypothetical protein [Clostridia bacterium]